MMKSYLSLAIKELKAQKIMAALILIAVILSSIMTTAIGSSLGTLQTMREEQAASLNGNRYGTFHQITQEQRLKLENNPHLYDVGSLINIGNMKLGNSGLTLYIREYLDDALNAYPFICKIKEGRLPTAPLEIALPENALQYLDQMIHVGDKITLRAQVSFMRGAIPAYEYSAEFTVCGILESNYIGYSSGTLEALSGEGTASLLLPKEYLLYSTDFKTKDTEQFQKIVDELISDLGITESNVQYNWILLNALGISFKEKDSSNGDTGFSFMTFSCVMVGILVLLAAGLVIYNIMKIAVAKRLKEYGILRAIGSERGQLYRLVSLQLLILCGIGIPIGLIIGSLSAKSILIAATGLLNPDLFMANSTKDLNTAIHETSANNIEISLVSAFVTLLFAMLAAFPAARYASHVSPTIAMSGQNVKIKRRNRKLKAIHSFESYYARLNLKRGGFRTIITMLSLVMSITVFVALHCFTSILDTSNAVKNRNWGDYSITNESIGMTSESIEKIRESQWVSQLATTKLSTYMHNEDGVLPLELDFSLQPWEAFHIAGIDDARFTSYTNTLSEQDINDLISGFACIVKNPIPFSYEGQAVERTTFKTNDILWINGQKLRVAGVTDEMITINNEGFANGVQIIVSHKAYDLLTGSRSYSEIYPLLEPNADHEEFEEWLDAWCNENPGSHWLSYQQTNAQLAESFEQIKFLCLGLILFIGSIGILNIINTVYSNIHTRISEIGMQRAIGMSTGSLYKTFLWEGAYYGIIASIVGGLLGYLCTIFINAATTDTLQLVAIPYVSILEAALISIAACLLATAIPLRAIAKMSIVASIEAVD